MSSGQGREKLLISCVHHTLSLLLGGGGGTEPEVLCQSTGPPLAKVRMLLGEGAEPFMVVTSSWTPTGFLRLGPVRAQKLGRQPQRENVLGRNHRRHISAQTEEP